MPFQGVYFYVQAFLFKYFSFLTKMENVIAIYNNKFTTAITTLIRS